VDRVAQALADPIRREILRLLRAEAATAGAIAGAFLVSRPAVSRHLRVLREAGLVEQLAKGRERRYCLQLAPLAELEAYLSELRAAPLIWQQRFDALATEVHRTTRRRRAAETQARLESEPRRIKPRKTDIA
jgi:DNA-binding transcriptional ArsR family regulator